MRKYLWLFLLLVPLIAYAAVDTFEGTAFTTSNTVEGTTGHDTVEGSAVASGASCTTANDGQLLADAITYGDTDQAANVNNVNYRRAVKVTSGTGWTITGYYVRMGKAGASDDFDVKCYLAPNDSDRPDGTSEVSNSAVTNSIAAADWLPAATFDDRWFELSSPLSVSDSTTYWLVCYPTVLTSGNPYFAVDLSTTGAWGSYDNDGGASWENPSENGTYIRSKIYGCSE